MQENVVVGESAITGTLKLVTDFTGFSGDVSLQSGNYLVLHAECDDATSITAELVGGNDGAKALDADGLAIFRVTSTTQSVKFVASDGTHSKTLTYALTGLTLNDE